MKVGPDAIALIKHFEGCRLRAYPDPLTGGSPWTIGYGSTGQYVCEGITWSQQQADERLANDLDLCESDLNNAISVPVTQRQFDAILSILYNVGHGSPIKDGIIRLRNQYSSSLLRKLNARDLMGASAEFLKWISPGSSVEKALLKRRTAEQAVFNGVSADDAIAIAEQT